MPAQAGTRRLAVLVGHNVGSGERPPLRYAEADAAKLASVLTELGDVAPSDLLVLQGRDLATVRGALERVARQVAALRAVPGTRVVLLFYFSGHSDGVALELGTERLPYADLRRWLEATRADVRLAIVDSCRSGALLRFKGGRPGPGFELRLTDELHSTGHALLTSSAEDELALESREVGGSLFTHHLVSGLRGAADSSGDGLVTLAEAYQYAYAHTVSATADVLLGRQHPAYDYRLSGKGELVLTQLPSPGTALELPSDFERALLLRPDRGQVLAELGPGAVPRLAVPPGDYELRAWRAGRQHGGTVRAAAGEVRHVRWEDLAPMPSATPVSGAKGAAVEPAPREPVLRLGIGAGLRKSVAEDMGPLQALRLELSGTDSRGLVASVEVARGARPVGREAAGVLALGYRWGTRRGALEAAVGVEAGAQFLRQSTGAGVGWALAPSLGPTATLSWKVASRLALQLGGRAPLSIVPQDGAGRLRLLPGAELGARVDL
nr:caspase family protein [Myxococcus sp. RHSTA-1-4]